jgi:hypothetical protein
MDNPSTEQDIELFQDFMGVGYFFHDVRPNVLLIFDNRRALVNTWSKIIKWWPDPDIRMVLIEKQNPASYEFYLHSDSKILNTKWVFLKSLKMEQQTLVLHYTGLRTTRMSLKFSSTKKESPM